MLPARLEKVNAIFGESRSIDEILVSGGEAVRIKNMGTEVRNFVLAGVDVAVVRPGELKVVPIDLEPGRYAFSLRDHPSIAGTLIIT